MSDSHLFEDYEYRGREPWHSDKYVVEQEAWRGDCHATGEIPAVVRISDISTSVIRTLAEQAARIIEQQFEVRQLRKERDHEREERLRLTHEIQELRAAQDQEGSIASLRVKDESRSGPSTEAISPKTPSWSREATEALNDLVGEHLVTADDHVAVEYALARSTLATARAVLEFAPDFAPMPEFSVGPNGEVLMDWWVSRKRSATLAITRERRLVFAMLFDDSRTRGSQPFEGQFPNQFALLLRFLFAEAERTR